MAGGRVRGEGQLKHMSFVKPRFKQGTSLSQTDGASTLFARQAAYSAIKTQMKPDVIPARSEKKARPLV